MVVVTSFRIPESPVRLEQRNISAVLDKKSLGTGTLFISEKTLGWQKEGTSGFSLDYYNVSLHAVSKDRTVCDRDCIYILTDPHISFTDENSIDHSVDDDNSDAESEADLSELIFVPEDPTQIQNIYEAIKVCQELNPDPADIDDEDDQLFEDAEEDEMYVEAESEQIEAEVNNLADRLQNNSVDVQINYRNGNTEDEEFEDVD